MDALHRDMRRMFVANLEAKLAGAPKPYTTKAIDDLLNQCTVIEYCEDCGDIFCPWGEQLHFHHDGCPCCSCIPDEGWDQVKADRMLLRRNKEG